MEIKQTRTRGRFFCLVLLSLLLCLVLAAGAEGTNVIYEGTSYPQNAEYIDLGDFVVTDFDAFMAFLDQMPSLRQVDMWQNRMTADQCDMLAARYPEMRWGWTMVIKNWNHEHLIRTDYTSWSTLHNNKSAKHSTTGSTDCCTLGQIATTCHYNSCTESQDDCLHFFHNVLVLYL